MTSDFNEVIKDPLHDWVEQETRALDVVASWESLCDTYRALEFSDPLSDTVRLEEFKWIIKQMNQFLARQRKKLLSCRTSEAMMEVLTMSFTPEGKVNIDQRKALAFQKLKQRWIVTMMARLKQLTIELKEMEESEDGWTDDGDA